MQHHRASGRARVLLSGRHHYLGPWGSREAQAEYDRLIGEWIAGGRTLMVGAAGPLTVGELCDAYSRFALATFIKAGRPTSTVHKVNRAVYLLERAGFADHTVAHFTPPDLKRFQHWLAQHPKARWTRSTINEYVRTVIAMFRWAVGEGWVAETVHRALEAVGPLRKGRAIPGAPGPLRDPRRVQPVDEAAYKAARKRMRPMLAAMVEFHRATGMRPGALLAMRGRDVKKTADASVRAYTVPPEAYKLDHLDEMDESDRVVYIGPRAWKIVRPWMPEDPDDYVWSPKRSELERWSERREARQVHMYDSHDPDLRRKRRGTRARVGERYSTDSYRRAITRACEAASVPAWSPNQLRHTAATEIADRLTLDSARVVLGHHDIKTTMRYAKPREKKAIKAVKRIG